MKLTANYKVNIEDGKADVEFSMEQADEVRINTLLPLTKFFSDVEKKVKNIMDKLNGPTDTKAETYESKTDFDESEEPQEEIQDSEEGNTEDETAQQEGGSV